VDDDPRRSIPATDRLLAVLGAELSADSPFERAALKATITRAQEQARRGEIAPHMVEQTARALYETETKNTGGMVAVLNGTGILVHTNLGRAPLAPSAIQAIATAAGYVDVELDLETGQRARRGEAARRALLAACPAAEDALIVNNGAGALLLAVAAYGGGRDVIISRGQLIEIGGGFRLPDVISAAGARLREVGTTNRTHLRDYEDVIGAETGCVLHVHPSNFVVEGFSAAVSISELAPIAAAAQVPLISDLGSGLVHPDPLLPAEPDVTSALEAGADLVIISGDKLLGGPQAGIIFGRAEHVHTLVRHPIARAVRADKLTYAALAATLQTVPPVTEFLHADPAVLRNRAEKLAAALAATGVELEVVPHAGHVGGGGAPTFEIPGWAVKLPEKIGSESVARRLREGKTAVLARTHDGACLVDLRCIPPERDEELLAAIKRALTLP